MNSGCKDKKNLSNIKILHCFYVIFIIFAKM